MSIDLLGDLTEEHCNSDRLYFNKDEVIKFIGVEPRVDEAKGHIFIKTTINSGEHKGKEYTIMIAGSDNDASKKRKAQFFFRSGFWTKDELTNKTYKLARIVGREFQGKASKVNIKGDEKYQNIEDIKDIGPAAAPDAAAGPVNY